MARRTPPRIFIIKGGKYGKLQRRLWRGGVTSLSKSLDEKVTKSDLFQLVYPVGSIYMSVNNTSPATLFGGT